MLQGKKMNTPFCIHSILACCITSNSTFQTIQRFELELEIRKHVFSELDRYERIGR